MRTISRLLVVLPVVTMAPSAMHVFLGRNGFVNQAPWHPPFAFLSLTATTVALSLLSASLALDSLSLTLYTLSLSTY